MQLLITLRISCSSLLQRKYLIMYIYYYALIKHRSRSILLQHQSIIATEKSLWLKLPRALHQNIYVPTRFKLRERLSIEFYQTAIAEKVTIARRTTSIKIFYACVVSPSFFFISFIYIYFHALQKESQGGEYGPPGQQPGQPIDSYGAPHPGPSGPY